MEPRYEVENVDGSNDYIISKFYRRRKWIIFGEVLETRGRFRGSSTVWRHLNGSRCGILTESELSDVIAKHEWETKEQK